jgi:drug/metabolite transporter (DMT)-like permease
MSAPSSAVIPSPLRGALWMGGAVLSFAVMAIAVRELLRHMGSFEILFFRTLVSLGIVLAALPRYGIGVLRTRRLGLHTLRNVLHFGGQYAWVYAIAMLPLATVFAIEFTMPVWTAVLATLILGERLNRGRVVMLVLGLAGILVILRPGAGFIHPAALVMLIGSLAYALLPALPHWATPRVVDLPWILAIGAGSFAAHYSMTRAFRLADATLVVPIDFLRLPLIAVVGALAYGEAIDPVIMLGAAVIFSGTYYSIQRESRGAVGR